MSLFEHVGHHLTGIEKLRRFLAEGLRPPMAELLDVRLAEVEEGRVVFEATPGERHYNPMGGVHGGYAATLLDFACGYATISRLDAGATFSTLEIKVSYQRPMSAQTGTVTVEGKVVSMGRRVAFVEGRVVDREGRLLASATSTCLLIPGERA